MTAFVEGSERHESAQSEFGHETFVETSRSSLVFLHGSTSSHEAEGDRPPTIDAERESESNSTVRRQHAKC